MDDIHSDPKYRLIRAALRQAEEALAAHQIDTAQAHYKEALGVGEISSEIADEIRQAIKTYDDTVISIEPPDWDRAHHALQLLETLGLANDQTRYWQVDLALKQATSLLERENLAEGFEVLEELATHNFHVDSSQLKHQIAGVLCASISFQANQQNWAFLKQLIERTQGLWPDDALHQWLEAMAQIVTAIASLQADSQLEIEGLKQSQKKGRRLVYGLIGLISIVSIAGFIALPLFIR